MQRGPIAAALCLSALAACTSTSGSDAAATSKRWVGRSETDLRAALGSPLEVQQVGGRRVLAYPAAQSTAYRFEIDPEGRVVSVALVNTPHVDYWSESKPKP